MLFYLRPNDVFGYLTGTCNRYAQRFDPGFGVNVGPYGVQALYAPLVNYNTEFPQLGVPPRGQLHMEPPPPPPIPQHMRAPWVPPVNAIGYRTSDATLLGHFNTGHMAPMAMYMHAPQFAYPGHAMTYMHPPDRFQQSISQVLLLFPFALLYSLPVLNKKERFSILVVATSMFAHSCVCLLVGE